MSRAYTSTSEDYLKCYPFLPQTGKLYLKLYLHFVNHFKTVGRFYGMHILYQKLILELVQLVQHFISWPQYNNTKNPQIYLKSYKITSIQGNYLKSLISESAFLKTSNNHGYLIDIPSLSHNPNVDQQYGPTIHNQLRYRKTYFLTFRHRVDVYRNQ